MLDAAEFNYYMYMQLISLEDERTKKSLFLIFRARKKNENCVVVVGFFAKNRVP